MAVMVAAAAALPAAAAGGRHEVPTNPSVFLGILVTPNGAGQEFDYDKADLADAVCQRLGEDGDRRRERVGARLLDHFIDLGYWVRMFFLLDASARPLPVNRPATRLWGRGPVHGPVVLVNEEYVQPCDFDGEELEQLLKVCTHVPIKTPQQQLQAVQRHPGLYNYVGKARCRKAALQIFLGDLPNAGAAAACSNPACPGPVPGPPGTSTKRGSGAKGASKEAAAMAATVTPAPKLLACSRCYRVEYCCKGCQLAHWASGHKVTCPKVPIDKLEEDVAVCFRAGLR